MTKAPGAHLRDEIAALLSIYYSDVGVEKRLTATTADVLYTDDSMSLLPRTIAIEAKDWAKSLTSKNISEIYSLYHPDLVSRRIDHLWIIGRHELAGSPRQTIDSLANVVYTTFDQFQSSLINLKPVLQHNISSFKQDESYANFIETRDRQSGQNLLALSQAWISGPKNGLILYGGYGLGKTTFSKYLSSFLSQEYIDGKSDRIPIRFALGDIYHKQDLVSLISSSLTGGQSGIQVKNFSYHLFLEMNRLGKFVLVFDGFDEMRHAIDLEDFIFNFKQMRPLLDGQGKVVILGRPDAFLSMSEENKVLSSLFDNPNLAEANLQLAEVGFFASEDIDKYMSQFMRSRGFSIDKTKKVDRLLKSIKAAGEDNILSRPVQLKMFTRVIDEFVDEPKVPNRYELYEQFIYGFIRRERTKAAREVAPESALPAQDPRAQFMQNTAWWILNSKKENRFIPSEISRRLIPNEIGKRHSDDAAVREALVGSVIEPMDHSGVLGKKGNRYYYFPHKSYIEFLVAQYFSYSAFTVDMYKEFIDNVTPEVLSFVQEGPVSGLENLRRGLDHATSYIQRFVIDAAATDPSIPKELAGRGLNKISAPRLYTYYLHLRRHGTAEDFLRRQLAQSGTPGRMLALINCTADCLLDRGDRYLARTLILNFLTSVFDEFRAREYARNKAPVEVYRRDDEIAVKAAALVEAVQISNTHVSLFPDALIEVSQSGSRGVAFVQLSGTGRHREIEISKQELIPPDMPANDHAAVVAAALFAGVKDGRKSGVPIVLKDVAARPVPRD
jgi:hypothetical protein